MTEEFLSHLEIYRPMRSSQPLRLQATTAVSLTHHLDGFPAVYLLGGLDSRATTGWLHW